MDAKRSEQRKRWKRQIEAKGPSTCWSSCWANIICQLHTNTPLKSNTAKASICTPQACFPLTDTNLTKKNAFFIWSNNFYGLKGLNYSTFTTLNVPHRLIGVDKESTTNFVPKPLLTNKIDVWNAITSVIICWIKKTYEWNTHSEISILQRQFSFLWKVLIAQTFFSLIVDMSCVIHGEV